MVAGMAVILLLVGIHNAWDTVTFIVVAGTTPHASETAKRAATGVPDKK
jgi:hypothetical protein